MGSSSTPRFAKIVSWKYAQLSAGKVSEDLGLNHCRPTSRTLVQSLGESVGEIARDTEFEWAYDLPPMPDVVKHIAISRDGTTTPIRQQGYRETMCGTLSFYNAKGDRLHTIYTACAPEYGKQSFDSVMDMELQRVKKGYPNVAYIGLADGAKNNWTYLESRTDVPILDFFHATEYLSAVSVAMAKKEEKRQEWLDKACEDLKNKKNGAKLILQELIQHKQSFNTTSPEILDKTITYFENNIERMNYPHYQKKGYPIGSGVTEAACKVIAKQRLSNSGMRWNIDSVQHILLLRGLIFTKGRWKQFWENVDKIGL